MRFAPDLVFGLTPARLGSMHALMVGCAAAGCRGGDTGSAPLSPVGIWEPLWWREVQWRGDASVPSFMVGSDLRRPNHADAYLRLSHWLWVLQIEPLDPMAGSGADRASGMKVSTHRFVHECRPVWPLGESSTVELRTSVYSDAEGLYDGENALFVERYEFDSSDSVVALQCEVDDPDRLVCMFNTGKAPWLEWPAGAGWPAGPVEYRRRLSLETLHQPISCDRLLERYLLSGGLQ